MPFTEQHAFAGFDTRGSHVDSVDVQDFVRHEEWGKIVDILKTYEADHSTEEVIGFQIAIFDQILERVFGLEKFQRAADSTETTSEELYQAKVNYVTQICSEIPELNAYLGQSFRVVQGGNFLQKGGYEKYLSDGSVSIWGQTDLVKLFERLEGKTALFWRSFINFRELIIPSQKTQDEAELAVPAELFFDATTEYPSKNVNVEHIITGYAAYVDWLKSSDLTVKKYRFVRKIIEQGFFFLHPNLEKQRYHMTEEKLENFLGCLDANALADMLWVEGMTDVSAYLIFSNRPDVIDAIKTDKATPENIYPVITALSFRGLGRKKSAEMEDMSAKRRNILRELLVLLPSEEPRYADVLKQVACYEASCQDADPQFLRAILLKLGVDASDSELSFLKVRLAIATVESKRTMEEISKTYALDNESEPIGQVSGTINLPVSALVQVLQSGRYRSALEEEGKFESGHAELQAVRNSSYYRHLRVISEERHAIASPSHLPSDPQTVYGAIMLKEHFTPRGAASAYGDAFLVVRENVVSTRCTFTVGDSLYDPRMLSLADAAKLEKIKVSKGREMVKGRLRYTEMQVIGGCALSDVEKICIAYHRVDVQDRPEIIQVLQLASEARIPVEFTLD